MTNRRKSPVQDVLSHHRSQLQDLRNRGLTRYDAWAAWQTREDCPVHRMAPALAHCLFLRFRRTYEDLVPVTGSTRTPSSTTEPVHPAKHVMSCPVPVRRSRRIAAQASERKEEEEAGDSESSDDEYVAEEDEDTGSDEDEYAACTDVDSTETPYPMRCYLRAPHLWHVFSATTNQSTSGPHPEVVLRTYTVRTDVGTCTCPDFVYRNKAANGEQCKHVREVLRVQAACQ